MTKDLFNVTLAVTMGIGVGMLLSVFGQKLINNHSISSCKAKPDHQLVHMTNSFVGDAIYCVNKNHL
jgi:hypothetical protein